MWQQSYMILHDLEAHHVVRMLMSQFVSRTSPSPILPAFSLKPNTEVSASSLSTVCTPNLVEDEDLERIERGHESRTTLMIKKVPRKYTLEILRREVDEVLACRNCYDLLYLPVDSAKMTNRGYAFINFTSPAGVAVFARAFRDREWRELNKRNKVAVIQWAYVQGRDATLAHIHSDVSV